MNTERKLRVLAAATSTLIGAVIAVVGVMPMRSASATAVPPINTSDRAAVVSAYTTIVNGTQSTAAWTGNRGTCAAGTIDTAYRDYAYTTMNYFRAMAGLSSSITENTTYRDQAQAAALINALNPVQADPHHPLPGVTCYSAAGATGAANSNLASQSGQRQNSFGVVRSWMNDTGWANVGHRYGILYPPATQAGYGDVPQGGTDNGGQAMWVFDHFGTWPTLSTPGGGVLWPPAGYVPYRTVFSTWSFMAQGADMTNAEVTVAKNGSPVATTVTFRGAPILTFRPDIPLTSYDSFGSLSHAPVAQDTTYNVTITGIPGKGTISYAVTVIDPAAVVSTPPAAPTALTLATSGANVNLTWIDASNDETGFEVQRARWVAGVWSEFVMLAPTAANQTSTTDASLPDGLYAYLVRSKNTAGTSDWLINVIQHTTATQPPPAPTNLVPTNSGNNVVLTWTDTATDEYVQEIGRARFNYTTQTWGEWTFFLADRNATSYTDTNVPDGQYAYLVRADNRIGASPWIINTVTHVNGAGAPAAPTNLTPIPSLGTIVLTWTDNATNEIVYEVLRARLVSGTWGEWTSLTLDKNTPVLAQTGLTPSSYAYFVRATNPTGSSAWATVFTVAF